ncbi:hypothetical protein AUEXF2481DRAFT_25187 [Aureobasidium subglaciale EXF-2481]|uniref:Uncharacterized protein n=1 Tax=Aureobasidium subglaciale (strain EXF-2481) TaxID=1043005 RepID=A0A074YT24_AURSE|nr:uncharacterized protein AUEXF2481DRAFT_25187 [Aureobasidium subglaciale EXF-2481]KER00909.1 hypothetical protein AUEXF2481DRAFT_25187 [Aureobasidium subglaciale EXF-2481]
MTLTQVRIEEEEEETEATSKARIPREDAVITRIVCFELRRWEEQLAGHSVSGVLRCVPPKTIHVSSFEPPKKQLSLFQKEAAPLPTVSERLHDLVNAFPRLAFAKPL